MFNFLKEKLNNSIQKIKETFGFSANSSVTQEMLKEALINMNFSYTLTEKIIKEIKNKEMWQKELYNYLKLVLDSATQTKENQVVLLTGINGSGKTTTAIKLANQAKKDGKTCLVPADTFRAAAKNQLIDLAKENNIDYLVSHANNPTSVIYDAYVYTNENNYSKIIIDTAGRIHQNENLLKELERTVQITKKYFSENKCTIYLVLDGLQGKNLLEQTTLFTEKIKIDGIILTKLDAGIKPGIIFSIIEKYKIPISYLGYGQQNTELVPFDGNEFLKLFLE